MATKPATLRDKILYRIEAKKPFAVWTSRDFIVLASRKLVDKTLQQLARSGELRRIGRGLYDKPGFDSLTNQPTSPDYREVIKAVSRRDKARMLIDGLTAAKDLGFTNSVPARVVVHTDARLFPIRVGNLVIKFKKTSASRLYWAGRPAMRVVQALHWLKDLLPDDRITKQLRAVLRDPTHGAAIREDLSVGLPILPSWMQQLVRELLS